MSIIEVKVPDIGDFDEVSVIELLVKPGDTIKAEQSLVTVESDKASMEIPSSAAGVVDKYIAADYIISTSQFLPNISTDLAPRLARQPELAAVSALQMGEWRSQGQGRSLYASDPATIGKVLKLDVTGGDRAGRAPGAEHGGGAGQFTTDRPRRSRRTPAMRRLISDVRLHPADLVLPLVVKEGISEPAAVASMPGVFQHTRDSLRKIANEAAQAGLGGTITFGIPQHKDALGSQAADPNGIVQLAPSDLAPEVGGALVGMSDRSPAEYTSHAHCRLPPPSCAAATQPRCHLPRPPPPLCTPAACRGRLGCLAVAGVLSRRRARWAACRRPGRVGTACRSCAAALRGRFEWCRVCRRRL